MCFHLKVPQSAFNIELILQSGPSITYVSQSPTAGGLITITGSNFGPADTNVVVMVNGMACTDVQYVIPHRTIICNAGAGSGVDLVVEVNVVGQNSSSYAFSYEGTLSK